MKDRIFTGKDVAEALAAAGASLGVPVASLRYVVLGADAHETRLAVLLDAPGPRPAAPRAPERRDPREGIRRVARELAEAAGQPIDVEIEGVEGDLLVRLSGEGGRLLLPDGGRPLRALEQLLRTIFGRELGAARLRVDCDGYRASRDAWLGGLARELAAGVRQDGRPRETEPLNAYDRRIVHLALGEEPGVRSFSVGEGRDRRVTVAPRQDGPPAGEGR